MIGYLFTAGEIHETALFVAIQKQKLHNQNIVHHEKSALKFICLDFFNYLKEKQQHVKGKCTFPIFKDLHTVMHYIYIYIFVYPQLLFICWY